MQEKLFYVVTKNLIDYELSHRFNGSLRDFPKLKDAECYPAIKTGLIGIFSNKAGADVYKEYNYINGKITNFDWQNTGHIQVKYKGYYYTVFPQVLKYNKYKDKEYAAYNKMMVEVGYVFDAEKNFNEDMAIKHEYQRFSEIQL